MQLNLFPADVFFGHQVGKFRRELGEELYYKMHSLYVTYCSILCGAVNIIGFAAGPELQIVQNMYPYA